MPTKRDKMIVFIADQIRLADTEIRAIPPSSPSYKVMMRLIVSMRDMLEILKGIIDPEPGD